MGDGKLKSKNYYWCGNLSQQNACWNRTHYVVSHENNILEAYTLFSSEDDVAFSLNLFCPPAAYVRLLACLRPQTVLYPLGCLGPHSVFVWNLHLY